MKHQHTATTPQHEALPRKKPARSTNKGNGASAMHSFTFGEGREEMIRQVAYSLYETRNFEDGHSVEDWLQAEAQIDQLTAPNLQAS